MHSRVDIVLVDRNAFFEALFASRVVLDQNVKYSVVEPVGVVVFVTGNSLIVCTT